MKILIFLSLLLFLPSSAALALDYAAILAAAPASVPAVGTYPTGSLVNDNGTIYFISGNTKIPFTNWQAFVGLGYSAGNVVNGDTSAYLLSQNYVLRTAKQDHPWGSWLLYKGTVYYYDQDGLIPVPSPEVFVSNGGNWNLVLPANQYDLAALTANPDVSPLTDNILRLSSLVASPNTPNNQDAATLNASLPQTDTSGQPFGFLDDQTAGKTASTTETGATTTPAAVSLPAAPSSVSTSLPSEPNITLPPTSTAGLPVAVTASATSPGGPPLSYVFNWGDGSVPVTSSSSTATHTYAAAGNYTVLVTVVNSAGMINSQSINISVGAKQ